MSRKEKWFSEVEKEYGSLEGYVMERSDGGAEPLFFGYQPFRYFWDKDLLEENDVIRTNLQGSYIDGHYKINSDGNLEGIEAAEGLYSGKIGIYTPKEILNIKNSDNGWTVDFFVKSRICLSYLENSGKI